MAFVNTGFDFEEVHPKIAEHCGLVVDLQHLISIWQGFQSKNNWPYLVNEYFSWVKKQHRRLENTKQVLATADIESFTDKAGSSEGQYILMKWLAEQQQHPLINPKIVQLKLPLTRNGLQ